MSRSSRPIPSSRSRCRHDDFGSKVAQGWDTGKNTTRNHDSLPSSTPVASFSSSWPQAPMSPRSAGLAPSSASRGLGAARAGSRRPHRPPGRARSTSSISRKPRTARSAPATGHTWPAASTTTRRCAPTAKSSSTFSCGRAACATPPRSTCASTCSAPSTPARFSCVPTGGEKSFHPDGELAVARAAASARHAAVPLHGDLDAVEDVNKALGRPVWYQLYAPSTWEACEQLLRRVEAAGCTCAAHRRQHHRPQQRNVPPHPPQGSASVHRLPRTARRRALHQSAMYDGINMTGVRNTNPAMDWAFVDRLRKFWKGKFFIKGIDTREDARLASSTASMASLSPITADVRPKPRGRRSRRCPKSWPKSATASPSSSTAVFAAAPMSSRPSRSAPKPWGSGVLPVGTGRVRPAGRRSRARNPAGRTEAGDGQLRHADRRRHQPRLRDGTRVAALIADRGLPIRVSVGPSQIPGEAGSSSAR